MLCRCDVVVDVVDVVAVVVVAVVAVVVVVLFLFLFPFLPLSFTTPTYTPIYAITPAESVGECGKREGAQGKRARWEGESSIGRK